MDKLERLLNLTAALLNTERPLSAGELRERIPGAYSEDLIAFRRMFERDKADLRAIGGAHRGDHPVPPRSAGGGLPSPGRGVRGA